ncbi:MAG: phage replisome organizer N-terminal domain-containing protein [Dehalococcoidales bacterium]|nr:phage replisome organizer N-terminal domain-containing protein [Dehalococcoidales bacterium]
MGNRTWIKLYCEKWIAGSIRKEKPEVRGIWADLLALAGSGLYGDTGEIKIQNGIGLTDYQFQKVLNVSRSQWSNAKNVLLNSGRIKVNDENVIHIINWQKYQSEYERTKKSRTKSTQESTQEREIENEIKERESKNLPLNSDISTVIDKVRAYMGYPGKPDPIADPVSEARHIQNMLERGFTADEIFTKWRRKVQQRGCYISMKFVSEDIARAPSDWD